MLLSDVDQRLVTLDFFVKRGSVLARGNGQRYDLGKLCQLATFGERLEVSFALVSNFQAQPNDSQPPRRVDDVVRLGQIRNHIRWFEVLTGFVDADFNVGIFKICLLYTSPSPRDRG